MVMRVSGLASGIDYESMIKQLMDAQRIPSIKLQQDRQILEWKQEQYRDINNTLRTFRDTVFNMKLQSTFLTKKTTIADGSVAAVTAGSNAVAGTYTFAVEQMAVGANITGEKIESDADKSTLGKQLASQDISGTQSITISQTLNGTTVTNTFEVDTDTESIYDLINEINNYKPEDGTWKVKASYDANLDRIFIMSAETGAGDIAVENGTDSTLADALKITTNPEDPASNKSAAYINGADASYQFNGVTYTSASNTVAINGLTFNLKGVSAKDDDGDPVATTVTVTNDTDAVVKVITDFVDQYNSLVETLSDKLYEKRYTDYEPLTDDQREKLTDDQIDQWIEKSKSGLLRNDTILSSILTKVRMTMSSVVPDVSGGYVEDGQTIYNDRLSEIGIKTTADYMSAVLEVNEDQLRKAVEKDPEGVMSLFTKTSDTDDYDEMGIASRLYQNINYGMDQIFDKAGSASDYNLVDESYIGKEIKDIDSRLEDWDDRLEQIEDRYYRQFSAMEQAISQLNQQSAWLQQQFGSSS